MIKNKKGFSLIPDAYGIVLFLNVLVCVLAYFCYGWDIRKIGETWTHSMWSLSSFTLGILMTFVLGYVLAVSPWVKKMLHAFAQWLPVKGIYLSTFLMVAFLSLINWGLGLVGCAVLARTLAAIKKDINKTALVMSSYAGFIVWHGGLTGSIPLIVSSHLNPLKHITGTIPLSEMLFSSWHLGLIAVMVVFLGIASWILPYVMKEQNTKEIQESEVAATTAPPIRRVERITTLFFCLIGLVNLIYIVQESVLIDMHVVNMLFFFVGLLLHKGWTPCLAALTCGVKNIVPIIFQFPLYASIAGLLEKTGMGNDMAHFFLQFADKDNLSFLTFLSAGLINLMIPSGGGQWVIQGPATMQAVAELGASFPHVIQALAWGDSWTNLIQPFWMLPVLSLCRIDLRDLLPYCMYYLIISGVVMGAYFLLWS